MNGDNNNNSNEDDDDDYDDGEKITQTNINILLLYFVLLLTNLILWDVFWLPFSWHACAMVSLFSRTQTIRSIQIRKCTTHVTVIYIYRIVEQNCWRQWFHFGGFSPQHFFACHAHFFSRLCHCWLNWKYHFAVADATRSVFFPLVPFGLFKWPFTA